jgi:hypothetical protein
LLAFGALDDLKGHFLASREGLETVPLDGGKMNEQILPALLFDETISLTGIEPFHASRWHLSDPSFSASVIPCPPEEPPPAAYLSKGSRDKMLQAFAPIALDAFNDGIQV